MEVVQPVLECEHCKKNGPCPSVGANHLIIGLSDDYFNRYDTRFLLDDLSVKLGVASWFSDYFGMCRHTMTFGFFGGMLDDELKFRKYYCNWAFHTGKWGKKEYDQIMDVLAKSYKKVEQELAEKSHIVQYSLVKQLLYEDFGAKTYSKVNLNMFAHEYQLDPDNYFDLPNLHSTYGITISKMNPEIANCSLKIKPDTTMILDGKDFVPLSIVEFKTKQDVSSSFSWDNPIRTLSMFCWAKKSQYYLMPGNEQWVDVLTVATIKIFGERAFDCHAKVEIIRYGLKEIYNGKMKTFRIGARSASIIHRIISKHGGFYMATSNDYEELFDSNRWSAIFNCGYHLLLSSSELGHSLCGHNKSIETKTLFFPIGECRRIGGMLGDGPYSCLGKLDSLIRYYDAAVCDDEMSLGRFLWEIAIYDVYYPWLTYASVTGRGEILVSTIDNYSNSLPTFERNVVGSSVYYGKLNLRSGISFAIIRTFTGDYYHVMYLEGKSRYACRDTTNGDPFNPHHYICVRVAKSIDISDCNPSLHSLYVPNTVNLMEEFMLPGMTSPLHLCIIDSEVEHADFGLWENSVDFLRSPPNGFPSSYVVIPYDRFKFHIHDGEDWHYMALYEYDNFVCACIYRAQTMSPEDYFPFTGQSGLFRTELLLTSIRGSYGAHTCFLNVRYGHAPKDIRAIFF